MKPPYFNIISEIFKYVLECERVSEITEIRKKPTTQTTSKAHRQSISMWLMFVLLWHTNI